MRRAMLSRRVSIGAVAIVVIVVIAIAGALTQSFGLRSSNDAPNTQSAAPLESAIAATVDNVPITVEELQLFIDKDRSSVAASFQARHNIAAIGSTFWATQYDGTTPSTTLKDKAVADAVRAKVEQILFLAEGVTTHIAADHLDEQLDNENLNRKASIAANKPIYGPRQFTKSQYYNYLLTNLRQSLKQALAKGALSYTPDQLQAYFQKEKKTRYTAPDEPTIEYVEILGPDVTAATSKKLTDAAISVRNGSTDLAKVAAAIDRTVHGTITMNQRTQKDIFGEDPVFAGVAQRMKTGEVLGPIDGAQGQYLAVCTSVAAGKTIDFPSHQDSIAQDYVSERYEEYVDAKAHAAVIRTFPDVIARISPN